MLCHNTNSSRFRVQGCYRGSWEVTAGFHGVQGGSWEVKVGLHGVMGAPKGVTGIILPITVTEPLGEFRQRRSQGIAGQYQRVQERPKEIHMFHSHLGMEKFFFWSRLQSSGRPRSPVDNNGRRVEMEGICWETTEKKIAKKSEKKKNGEN